MSIFPIDNYILKLPIEIRKLIIPYTYRIQHADLLKDIRNYTKTLQIINKLYFNYWIVTGWYRSNSISFPIDHLNDHNEWLINDIFGYANDDKGTAWGFTLSCYHLCMRFPFIINIMKNKSIHIKNCAQQFILHNTAECPCCVYKQPTKNLELLLPKLSIFNNYIIYLENKAIITQIRIFWGMFTPYERDKFLKYRTYLMMDDIEILDEYSLKNCFLYWRYYIKFKIPILNCRQKY